MCVPYPMNINSLGQKLWDIYEFHDFILFFAKGIIHHSNSSPEDLYDHFDASVGMAPEPIGSFFFSPISG